MLSTGGAGDDLSAGHERDQRLDELPKALVRVGDKPSTGAALACYSEPMPSPKSFQLRPDFTGIWRANLEKSILRGPVPREILHRIEHREPHLDQEIRVAEADGNEQHLIFSYNTAGDETTNLIAGKTARTRALWDGNELVIESWLDILTRQLHLKDHWSLSDDGETLTMAHRDDDLAGQIVVLDKAPLFLVNRSGAVT